MTELSEKVIAKAYYDWLLAEALPEAESACARFKRVQSEFSAYLVEQTSGWPASEVATLLRSQIKKTAWTALNLKLTEEEKRLVNAIEWPVVNPDLVGRTQVVWELRRRRGRGEFRIDKKVLRRALRSRMDQSFGKPQVIDGMIRYTTDAGKVLVCTDIEYPTKGLGQFTYTQCVYPNAHGGRVVGKAILRHSIFQFAGLCIDTAWNCIPIDGIPEAVDNLAYLCADFVQRAPGIVDAAPTMK